LKRRGLCTEGGLWWGRGRVSDLPISPSPDSATAPRSLQVHVRISIDLPSLLLRASACRGTRAFKAPWKVQRLTCIDISGASDSRIYRIATQYAPQLIDSNMAPSRALVRSRSWVRYSCPLAEKCDCQHSTERGGTRQDRTHDSAREVRKGD
jgi:hypothetical protein